MLCPTCNADVPADAAFCPKCGQQLSGAVQQPTAQPAAVAVSPADRLRPGQHPVPHEEEKELWRGSYSPKAMLGGWILAAILTVACVAVAVGVPNQASRVGALVAIAVVWLIPAYRLLVLRLSVEYTLTTQRFLHKKGLLRRVADQILLVDIDDITYEQGLLGRMLNFGTITLRAKDASLRTKDSSNEKLTLVPVDDVQRVANLIDEARREERRKRAIYMANA